MFQNSIQVVFYSADKKHGLLLFVRRLRSSDFEVVHNGYQLDRYGSKWEASEGNGALGTYQAMSRYVNGMEKLPLMTVTVTPFSAGCRAQG